MSEASGLSGDIDRIVRGAPQPVVVVDAGGRMVAANEQFVELFGHDEQDILKRPIELVLPAGGGSGGSAGGSGRAAGGSGRAAGGSGRADGGSGRADGGSGGAAGPLAHGDRHGRMAHSGGRRLAVRSDGTAFDVDVAFGTLTDGHAWVAVRELSGRRPSETETTRRLSGVDGHEDEAIVRIIDGVITDWNRAAERVYGYRRHEAIGRQISILVPPDRATELTSVLARIGAGGPTEELDTVRVRKDGRRMFVRLSVSPIRDGHARVVGVSTAARELSGLTLPDRLLRLEPPDERRHRDKEINDTIVQRLVVAEGCLELGDLDDALASVRAALAAARDMADRLLDDASIVPGGLVRGEPISAVLESRSPPPENHGRQLRRTLLIADGSPDIRTLVRRLLQRAGEYTVVAEAADGAQAIAAARVHQPAVILLDLSMSGVGGFAALPKLLHESPGSRVVVMSGLGDESLVAAAMADGAVGHLGKTDLYRTLVPFLNDTVRE